MDTSALVNKIPEVLVSKILVCVSKTISCMDSGNLGGIERTPSIRLEVFVSAVVDKMTKGLAGLKSLCMQARGA